MSRRLPPLPALRSFESAARHLSFKLAAEELHVSPSAISHAVQSLEEAMGVRLFHRRVRELILTDAGHALLPPVREAFDQIEEATAAVTAFDRPDLLTLGSTPIFTRVWLLPRLATFQEAHPDVDIRLLSPVQMVDIVHEKFDIGIMYGAGSWPGVDTTLLARETVVPVCSPSLARGDIAGRPPLSHPKDLARHTLIHNELRVTTWRMWLEAEGIRGINAERGMRFDRAALAIEAALNGLGVALEGTAAVRDYIARGELMIPFDLPNAGQQAGAYYLVHLPGKERIPKVAAFKSWVIGIMDNDRPPAAE